MYNEFKMCRHFYEDLNGNLIINRIIFAIDNSFSRVKIR